MSINFLGIRILPFIGQPYAVDVVLCNRPSKAVPINVDWNVYWQAAGNPANVGISLDLGAGRIPSSGGLLKKIQSVKIDNTNSLVPIYVIFPDTQDTVTCAPQTVAFLPVITNNQKVIIITQGLSAGFIPTTRIFFCEELVPGLIDPALQITYPQWLGSPLIQRTNTLTPGYGPPALADQAISKFLDYSNPAGAPVFPQSVVVLPAVASGFYYISAIQIAQVTTVLATASPGIMSQGFIWHGDFIDTFTLVPVVTFQYTNVIVNAVQRSGNGFQELFNTTGLNFRLDATHNYALRITSVEIFAIGTAIQTLSESRYTYSIFAGYTYNAN